MQEKVSLTIFKEQSVYQAVQILKEIGFPPIGEPVPISGGDEAHRTIAFLVNPNQPAKTLEEQIWKILGVIRCSVS